MDRVAMVRGRQGWDLEKALAGALFLILLLCHGPLAAEPLDVGAEPFQSEATDSADPTEVEGRLRSIQARVGERETALSRLATQRQALDAELLRLKADIQRQSESIRGLESEIVAAKVEQDRLQKSKAELSKRIDQEKERAALRLRGMYLYRPAHVVERLLGLSSPRGDPSVKGVSHDRLDATRVAYFLSLVRASDRALLVRLGDLQAQAIHESARLASVIEQRESLRGQLEQQRAKLRERGREKELVLARISEERQTLEVVLSELKAESLRLEVVVASLTTDAGTVEIEEERGGSLVGSKEASVGGRASMRVEPPQVPKVASGDERGTQTEPIAPPGPYDGPGLRAQRKSLVAPARGTVVRRFGKQRHGEFSDFVFQKGVELNIPPEQPIKAVASGRVAFAGELPGFGKVVIVDHGSRSYTLYGRLKDFSVAAGIEVERGKPIGGVLPVDKRGSNFYFEVRENGAPVNPASLFSNL